MVVLVNLEDPQLEEHAEQKPKKERDRWAQFRRLSNVSSRVAEMLVEPSRQKERASQRECQYRLAAIDPPAGPKPIPPALLEETALCSEILERATPVPTPLRPGSKASACVPLQEAPTTRRTPTPIMALAAPPAQQRAASAELTAAAQSYRIVKSALGNARNVSNGMTCCLQWDTSCKPPRQKTPSPREQCRGSRAVWVGAFASSNVLDFPERQPRRHSSGRKTKPLPSPRPVVGVIALPGVHSREAWRLHGCARGA